jgi:mRNA-degrading endonuclease RelE of RelBE toxin-antitoxin system
VTLLTKRADKDLSQLPDQFAGKAKELIRRLGEEPALGKKLQGPLNGQRSARLGRSHRIIYTLSGSDIVVLTIVARKDAYR